VTQPNIYNLLIDGGHLIRRIAYTPQGQLTTSKGEPSGLAHGFFSSLASLSREYSGNARAFVAFDSGKSKYRTDIYPDYKCDREDMTLPEYTGPDFGKAKRYIKTVLQIAGIPCFMSHGIEADDFIAALTYQFPQNSVIVSSDRDFFQLVTDGVVMYDPIRRFTFNIDEIISDKYDRDCWVDQYILHSCIIGDKDEVPPLAKGLGKVRALPLAKMLSRGCKLPNDNIYSSVVMENFESLDRNVQLFDLSYSVDALRPILREVISSFVPVESRGIELERSLVIAFSKWDLKSVSGSANHILKLRSLEPIIPTF
jgi:5'-3' exonuclease